MKEMLLEVLYKTSYVNVCFCWSVEQQGEEEEGEKRKKEEKKTN